MINLYGAGGTVLQSTQTVRTVKNIQEKWLHDGLSRTAGVGNLLNTLCQLIINTIFFFTTLRARCYR